MGQVLTGSAVLAMHEVGLAAEGEPHRRRAWPAHHREQPLLDVSPMPFSGHRTPGTPTLVQAVSVGSAARLVRNAVPILLRSPPAAFQFFAPPPERVRLACQFLRLSNFISPPPGIITPPGLLPAPHVFHDRSCAMTPARSEGLMPLTFAADTTWSCMPANGVPAQRLSNADLAQAILQRRHLHQRTRESCRDG